MKTLNKTLLAATLVSGLSMASTNAMAFAEFDIQEGAIAGTLDNGFTADRIIGGYEEKVTITGANTFSTSLVWNAGSFSNTNDGPASLPAHLGEIGVGGYEMYALFLGTGTFATVGAETTFTFTAGTFTLYSDEISDTGFTGTTGLVDYTRINFADDKILGSGDIITGSGRQECDNSNNNDCGSFGTRSEFNLTALGDAYFEGPVPFYNVAFESGNFNEINLNQGVTTDVSGVMNVTFNNVPEPTSLALMGLGFIGFGFAKRKKAK